MIFDPKPGGQRGKIFDGQSKNFPVVVTKVGRVGYLSIISQSLMRIEGFFSHFKFHLSTNDLNINLSVSPIITIRPLSAIHQQIRQFQCETFDRSSGMKNWVCRKLLVGVFWVLVCSVCSESRRRRWGKEPVSEGKEGYLA